MTPGIPGPLRDPRAWGLLAVSIVCASRGLAYTVSETPEPLPLGLDVIATIFPIWIYGIAWILAAIDGVWLATGRRAAWAVAFMTGMPTLWGAAYFIGWIASGFHNRDWITVVLYWCLSVIVVCFGVIPPKGVRGDAARSGPE